MKKVWSVALLFLFNDEVVSWFALIVIAVVFACWLFNKAIEAREV